MRTQEERIQELYAVGLRLKRAMARIEERASLRIEDDARGTKCPLAVSYAE